MSSADQPKAGANFKKVRDGSWPEQQRGSFSDEIDRQNGIWIPGILFFLVLLIHAFCAIQPKVNYNIVGTSGPVWCKNSANVSDAEFQFALDYCQTQNIYYVEDHEMINGGMMDTMTRQIGYYHWAQVLLTLQAVVFLVPNLLWIYVQKKLGADFGHFIGWARAISTIPLDDSLRHDNVRKLASELWAVYFPTGGNHKRRHRSTIGRQVGIPIWMLYMIFKISYLLLAIGQILWLNALLGDNEHFLWGWHILRQLTGHEAWQESRVFPRVAFCAVPSRQMGNAPHYMLQCHLRLNTYNEKIFLLIWWFLLYVAITTLLDIIEYICLFLFFPRACKGSIRWLLPHREFTRIMASRRAKDVQLVHDFSQVHLGREGMLLLWMIVSNADEIVTREICAHLFGMYTGRKMMHD